jgi:hypothetical protein
MNAFAATPINERKGHGVIEMMQEQPPLPMLLTQLVRFITTILE